MINFYNIWAGKRESPKQFLVVRYEDLRLNPLFEIQRILGFLQLSFLSEKLISDVIEFTSLENMRRMEREQVYDGGALKLYDELDPESFKARRGKVGGYVDYLNQNDINFLNNLMIQLWPGYGYSGIE